jgi:hypothetical protein
MGIQKEPQPHKALLPDDVPKVGSVQALEVVGELDFPSPHAGRGLPVFFANGPHHRDGSPSLSDSNGSTLFFHLIQKSQAFCFEFSCADGGGLHDFSVTEAGQMTFFKVPLRR